MCKAELFEAQQLVVRVLLGKRYPQQSLMSPDRFASHAADRGIEMARFRLDRLEEHRLLLPVLRCKAPVTRHRILTRRPDGSVEYDPRPLEDGAAPSQEVLQRYAGYSFSGDLLASIAEHGEILWPGRGEFVPWAEYRAPDAMPTVWTFYHPYQVLHADRVQRAILRQIFIWDDGSLTNWDAVTETFRAQCEAAHQALARGHARSLRVLALLLAIEDMYLPFLRDRFTFLGVDANQQDWDEWQRDVDRAAIVAESGWTVEEVKDLRMSYARDADVIDPNRHLFLLLRHLSQRERSRLRGSALLAWDYYEVAELLGLFLGHLTGQRQPRIDELWGRGEHEERLYGVPAQDVDYARRNVLASLSRRLGLDVRPRVLWIVEGQSEEAFIETTCEIEGIDLDARDIRLVCMFGVTPNDRLFNKYLDLVRDWSAALLLTVDGGDVGADELVRTVAHRKLGRIIQLPELDDPESAVFGVLKWDPCFEDANFTAEQLFQAWLRTAEERLAQAHPGLNPDTLRGHFRELRAKRPNDSPLQVVEDFARTCHCDYSKVEAAAALPEVLRAQRAEQADTPMTPIEKVLAKALDLAAYLRTAPVHYDDDADAAGEA